MIKMTFEVITPVLLRRGVIERNGKKYYHSDLSGQTFRGLLRWWFRFLALSGYSAQDVLEFEKILFGSSGESGTGASPVAIVPIIDESKLEAWENYENKLPPYFTGFRFFAKKKHFQVIPPGREVDVNLLWQLTLKKLVENKDSERNSARDLLDKYENAKDSIFGIYKNLLKALSVMGGIGAAWRRCLGSLQLKEDLSMSTLDELKRKVYKIKEAIFDDLKKLRDIFEISSSESVIYCVPNHREAKIFQIDEADNWEDLIENMTYSKANTRRNKSPFLQELRRALKEEHRNAVESKDSKEEIEKIAMARAFLGYPVKHLVMGFFIKPLNELKNDEKLKELEYTPVYEKLVFPRDADELAQLAQMYWPNKKRNKLRWELLKKIPRNDKYLIIERIPSVLILTAKKMGNNYVGLGIYVPYWRECVDLFPREYGEEIDEYLNEKIDDILKINCSNGGI